MINFKYKYEEKKLKMLKIGTKSSTITLFKIFSIIIKRPLYQEKHYNKKNRSKFNDNNNKEYNNFI